MKFYPISQRMIKGDISAFKLLTAANLVTLKLNNFSLLLMISHTYSVASRSDFSFSILAPSIKSNSNPCNNLTLRDVLRYKLITVFID